VHDPKDPYKGQYDEELVLTMSDWYHDKVPKLIASMVSPSNPRGAPPFPNALLVNESTTANFKFIPGKTYKIKMINMAAFASVLIQFDSHPMNIIEADGSYTVKKEAYQLRIAPAQRYSVLLKAQTSTRRNYAFLASLDMNRDFTNTAVAPVWPFNVTGNIIYDEAKALAPAYVVPKWKPFDDATLVAQDGEALLGPREKVDKEITLDFNFQLDPSGIARYVKQRAKSKTPKFGANPSQNILQQHYIRPTESAFFVHCDQHRDIEHQPSDLRRGQPIHCEARRDCPDHGQQSRWSYPPFPFAWSPVPSSRETFQRKGQIHWKGAKFSQCPSQARHILSQCQQLRRHSVQGQQPRSVAVPLPH